ncbi:pilus assembly PilX family protein [Polaromonas sp.]|uniref:pilus assembly PilX family protein n=1 Tax=Polaromonas sp. TaxID=1869339 RepID=UPI003BA943A6
MKPALLHITYRSSGASGTRGSSLVVVLIMLSVIFVIGVISARLSLFSERASRNDRDRQIAFQSAEAALLDAELDILGPNTAGNRRVCAFDSLKPAVFVPGCGTGSKTGMCLSTTVEGEGWKNVKAQYSTESGTATSNLTVQFGQFTGQSIAQGSGGLPVKPARYTIEAVRYAGTGNANDSVGNDKTEYAFLVTAMGFGLRPETQVLLQALIYKPANKPNAGCA